MRRSFSEKTEKTGMKKHILLVDDDKDELIIFMDALRRVPAEDGFKCTYASSTSQAIEMLKYLVPDYIFADFNIPGMNGLEFLQNVKGQQRFRSTQLLLYSMHISEETKNKSDVTGIGYLQKTATIDLLVRKLFDLLTVEKQANDYF